MIFSFCLNDFIVDLTFIPFNPNHEGLALLSPAFCLCKQPLGAHFLPLKF